MLTNWKRKSVLLMLSLLLTGCASFKPPLIVEETQIPSAPQELMEPEVLNESYSTLVRELLLLWARKLTDWRKSS